MFHSNKMVRQLRLLVADIIHLIHYLLVIFILSGWLFSANIILTSHVILIPIIILHWKTNRGRCILTEIEGALRRVEKKIDKKNEQESFVKKFLAKFFDPLPSDEKIKAAIYISIWSSWTISLLKILLL